MDSSPTIFDGTRTETYSREYQQLTFREEGPELAEALARTYPEQWVAIAVCETDQATGMSRGELLAHDWDGGSVTEPINEYHERYPNRVIKFFRTGRSPRRTDAQKPRG